MQVHPLKEQLTFNPQDFFVWNSEWEFETNIKIP